MIGKRVCATFSCDVSEGHVDQEKIYLDFVVSQSNLKFNVVLCWILSFRYS